MLFRDAARECRITTCMAQKTEFSPGTLSPLPQADLCSPSSVITVTAKCDSRYGHSPPLVL